MASKARRKLLGLRHISPSFHYGKTSFKPGPLCFMRKRRTRKQAHLVLPTRKANAEKPKEPVFPHTKKMSCDPEEI